MSYLTRYMTFPKIVDFFQVDDEGQHYLKIPFTRLNIQEDPIEGITNINAFVEVLRDYYEYKSVVEDGGGEILDIHATMSSFASENKNTQEESIKKIQKIRNSSYVSCWVNSEEEHLPMWNLYANRQGAIVQIDKDSLIGKLNEMSVTSDTVCYEKNVNDLEKAPFHKNDYYSYENEFRFLITDDSRNDVILFKDVYINSSKIKVKTHPQAEPWIKNNYNTILKNHSVDVINSDYEFFFNEVSRYLEKDFESS